MEQPESQFVCNLFAMSAEQRAIYPALRQRLNENVIETRELPDGYAFRHPIDLLMTAVQWVDLERLCCPFFKFAILVDGERLWVELTGEEGAKAVMKAELVHQISESEGYNDAPQAYQCGNTPHL
jgi:hypothetical protein